MMNWQGDKTALRQILVSRFNQEELNTLCQDLDIDYENLPGETKTEQARELIEYLDNRNKIPELIETGQKQRPDIDWDNVLATEANDAEDSAQGQLEDGEVARKGLISRIGTWFGKASPAEQLAFISAIVVAMLGLCGTISGIILPLFIAGGFTTPAAPITPTSSHTPTATIPAPISSNTSTPATPITPTSSHTPIPTIPTPTSSNTPIPTIPTPTSSNTPIPTIPIPTSTEIVPPAPTPEIRMVIGDTFQRITAQLNYPYWRLMELCVANHDLTNQDCWAYIYPYAREAEILRDPQLKTPNDETEMMAPNIYRYPYESSITCTLLTDANHWDIAVLFYEKGYLWPEICVANRDILRPLPNVTRKPDNYFCGQLKEGMVLKIPKLDEFYKEPTEAELSQIIVCPEILSATSTPTRATPTLTPTSSNTLTLTPTSSNIPTLTPTSSSTLAAPIPTPTP